MGISSEIVDTHRQTNQPTQHIDAIITKKNKVPKEWPITSGETDYGSDGILVSSLNCKKFGTNGPSATRQREPPMEKFGRRTN